MCTSCPCTHCNECRLLQDSRQYSDEEDGLADDDSEVDESEHENPEQVAKDLFAKLIHPHNPQTFFKKNWLKKPMHISRGDKSYYEEDNWFSTSELDRILTEVKITTHSLSVVDCFWVCDVLSSVRKQCHLKLTF